MNVTGIIIAVCIVGGVGLFVGLFLGIAGIKFKVEVDEKEELVLAALPGNNCGGCGYPGCSGLAAAIAKGEAKINACPVGGQPVADVIAGIMGVDSADSKHMVAFVKCQGTIQRTEVHFEYSGIKDCRMLSYVPNKSEKFCTYGCLGYGTCVKECPFDAIHIKDGVAVVDREKCKACGKCIAVCPKGLIELVPYEATNIVACSSKDKGPVTMKACDTGCIGCGLCKRNCPVDAIIVEDFHAYIDQEKCIHCGLCAEKCPKKSIVLPLESE